MFFIKFYSYFFFVFSLFGKCWILTIIVLILCVNREISLLIRSDGHPNVVRYYTKEEHSDFVYLGLQLCDFTLKYVLAYDRFFLSVIYYLLFIIYYLLTNCFVCTSMHFYF